MIRRISSRKAGIVASAGLAAVLVLGVAASTSVARGGPSGSSSPSVEDLGWLAGHWAGDSEELGGLAEEGWFGPAGGSMSGLFRLVSGDEVRVFELMLIEQEGDDIFYRFKHVGPGYREWEEQPLEYRLIELDERRVVFESATSEPESDAPRQIVYERTDDATLRLTIVGWEPDSGFDIIMTRQ